MTELLLVVIEEHHNFLSVHCVIQDASVMMVRVTKKSDIYSGNESHMAQADVLLCPTNVYTVSHPVMAWKTERARVFCGSREAAISWARM